MGKTSKTIAVFLTIIIAMSCLTLVMVTPANAQTSPEPSIPEFTVRFIDNSHQVLPTTTIDPYSGQTIVKEGYLAVNRSIEVAIEKPPARNYDVFYNIRVKGHFEENWTQLFDSRSYPQSLLIKFTSTEEGYYYSWHSALLYAPSGGQIDIQVKAIVGHYSQIIDNQPQLPWSTGYLTIFDTVSESNWSNIQTLNLADGSVTKSSTTSPAPTAPELSWLAILPLLISALSIALLLKHRKATHG